MKLQIRRIGNSLGVIVPKVMLDAWRVGAGDHLELTDRGIRPAPRAGLSHESLDDLRRDIALAVVRGFSPREIRAQILANLHRWAGPDSLLPVFEEWRELAAGADDGALFAAMLGRDEEAVRLRQSMPFVGLLSREEVQALYEKAAA